MENTIYDAIASDLELEDYRGAVNMIAERYSMSHYYDGTSTLYRAILLYTAASLWIKASVIDPLHDNREVSKKHSSDVCNKFLNKFIQPAFSDLGKWFECRNNTAGNHILNRMLQCGELDAFGLDPSNIQLSMPSETTEYVDNELTRIKGLAHRESLINYSGLSQTTDYIESVEMPEHVSNSEWVDNFLNGLSSKQLCSNQGVNRFDPYGESFDSFKKSEGKFRLLKGTMNNGSTIFVIRYNNNQYRLEDTVISHELNRFVVELNKKSKVVIKQYSDPYDKMITVQFPTLLPSRELAKIHALLWPVRDIDDGRLFMGPEYLRDYVYSIIDDLGFEKVVE